MNAEYKLFIEGTRTKYEKALDKALIKYRANKNIQSYKEFIEIEKNKLEKEVKNAYEAYKRALEDLYKERDEYYKNCYK